MKIKTVLIASAVALAAAGIVQAAGTAMEEKEMGLSKSSVFDVPVPPAWDYVTTQGTMPRYFGDAPPMIPHSIAAYENITPTMNMCVSCHKQPDKMGQKVAAGMPTPMPASRPCCAGLPERGSRPPRGGVEGLSRRGSQRVAPPR